MINIDTNQWQSIILGPDVPAMDAVSLLESREIKLVLVADAQKVLLGTVTDGDIRRGLLAKKSLEDPIKSFMNTKPMVYNRGQDRETILAKMEMRDIFYIPIIEDGKVTGLHSRQSLKTRIREKENIVFLMAGGEGKRLRPLTNSKPKPMIEIDGKPILQIILEQFLSYQFRRFYISVNFKADMIKAYFGDGSQWGCDIRYIDETKPLGTAGSLGFIEEEVKQPLIVSNSDLLTKLNYDELLNFHRRENSYATMTVREHVMTVPYGVTNIEGVELKGITEKPMVKQFINAGIYVLNPQCLDYVEKDEYLDMPQLIEKALTDQKRVCSFPIYEYWRDIGHFDELDMAKEEYDTHFKENQS